ncbi:TetR/AcrR family transcriptional regulator [Streptomyces sp. NRRL S-1448]|uniref:TetR/AcrR family transcriptional regulator n=1 Tax=Streptomyces sp. NRRL S-1448 TaxID=1463883 RepID=UPI00056D8A6B|nr:TetR family transcriptional regulator [Streptomyces sp. NRRL S-1448]
MAGLRERKKAQTRQRIAAVAWQLFAERGFEAVTVNEIAEAAEVAKATLFAYFPTKESLALQGVGDDDLAGIVTRRPAGQSPLEALRAHFRALAAGPMTGLDPEALVTRIRVIFDSPALSAAANALLYQQRQQLAEALKAEAVATGEEGGERASRGRDAGEPDARERAPREPDAGERASRGRDPGGPDAGGRGEMAAALMAAQISASLVTLQEAFFRRLADGTSPDDARQRLAEDVELAFSLLADGLETHTAHRATPSRN